MSAKEIEKPSAGQPMGFVARDSEPEAGHAVMISSALPMSISTASPRRVFPVRAKKKPRHMPASDTTHWTFGGRRSGRARRGQRGR